MLLLSSRKNLQAVLGRYATNTLKHINTVKSFSNRISRWILGRGMEIEMMLDIKERAKKEKFAALEEELAEVLKATLNGLMELNDFLDGLEKLAFTSLHIFRENNNMLHLPPGISLDLVQDIITAAQQTCPLRLMFMLDTDDFFVPQLQNLEVLCFQLNKYMIISQLMCDKMEKSDWRPPRSTETNVELPVDLSEDHIQEMLTHIKQLHSIRLNQNFRIAFMFQDDLSSTFLQEFDERRDRMLEFLDKLDESTGQMDRMHKGARISSIAGSSVGAVGGVMSIVGLALSPVTAGLSLGLTIAGISLGVTSGVNSIVTTLTEVGVNKREKNKASKTLEDFMKDAGVLYECLEKVGMKGTTLEEFAEAIANVAVELDSLEKTADVLKELVDTVSTFRMFNYEELITGVGRFVMQGARGAGKLVLDIPDIGQAAARGAAGFARAARAGFIALNALFVGIDVFFIVKDGLSLAKGSKSELVKFFTARAALWRSQMTSWEKIYESQKEGQERMKIHLAALDTPFYPGRRSEEESRSLLDPNH
uniref:Apolipoprotein L n=1 Tax=Takifugu rubripes TaxID=31033 RepID=A0A674N6F6_TAKRU